jgi:hypothetical protein
MRERIGAELELDDQRARQGRRGLAGGTGGGGVDARLRLPEVTHNPRPFQPAFGSSMRPSRPLAKKPIG